MVVWLIVALVAVLVVLVLWSQSRPLPPPDVKFNLGLPEGEPIVLVHGLMGFDNVRMGKRLQVAYFRGIARRLESAGYQVHVAKLPMIASVPDRAAKLAEFVRSLPGEKVTIFAHSMGGLDARYAVSKLGLEKRVSRLVTIGTPHGGTPLADFYFRGSHIARWFMSLIGIRFDALEWLTTERMRQFSKDVPDHPSVKYYSVVTHTRWLRLFPNLSMLLGYWYLQSKGGDNDGLVPCVSQRWGNCILEMEAHHWDQVGWSWRSRAPRVYEALAKSVSDDSAK